MKRCSNCGAVNKDMYSFCTSCGHILNDPAQNNTQIQNPNPVTASANNGFPQQNSGYNPANSVYVNQNSGYNTANAGYNMQTPQQGNPQVQADSGICNITFQRPNNFQYVANVFRITIDGVRYDLRNNSSITVQLPFGQHKVSISVFGVIKKKNFDFTAGGNTTFICTPNPAAAISNFSAPVKVTDISGRVY